MAHKGQVDEEGRSFQASLVRESRLPKRFVNVSRNAWHSEKSRVMSSSDTVLSLDPSQITHHGIVTGRRPGADALQATIIIFVAAIPLAIRSIRHPLLHHQPPAASRSARGLHTPAQTGRERDTVPRHFCRRWRRRCRIRRPCSGSRTCSTTQ